MKAIGDNKRLPISDSESLVDREASTPQLGGRDRRSFLIAVGRTAKALAAARVLGSGAAILGPGAMPRRAGRAEARTRQPLIQPSEIRSENGVLKATITAAPGRVQLGDFAFPGFLYNGAYVPPLLRPRLGDSMRITFRNALPDAPSNLHYHGMGVSPQGNSDNVFVHVHPGQQFEYEVRIPATGRQRPGFFWYHPHAHGFVEKQLRGGMSGGLVIAGSCWSASSRYAQKHPGVVFLRKNQIVRFALASPVNRYLWLSYLCPRCVVRPRRFTHLSSPAPKRSFPPG